MIDFFPQLDITDDGFLSLMNDNGDTKDDVKLPEGEVGERINRLFNEEGKDTSMSQYCFSVAGQGLQLTASFQMFTS